MQNRKHLRETATINITSHQEISDQLKYLADVLASKIKERYEAVAKMPVYPVVIAKRCAEVEAMLDAGNQKEFLVTQRV